MDIGIPLRELGTIDSSGLRKTILNQDRVAWGEDQYRQDEYEVHRQTESIVLLFTDGADWQEGALIRTVTDIRLFIAVTASTFRSRLIREFVS